MSLNKFLAFNSKPTIKSYSNLPQHITYLRLFLGFMYGLSLSFRENIPTMNINGGAGLIFGLNIITFIPIIYMNYYLNVDTDTFKGVTFAGVANALALMLLVWIIFFTMLHEDEENMLTQGLIFSTSTSDSSISGSEDNNQEGSTAPGDSEF